MPSNSRTSSAIWQWRRCSEVLRPAASRSVFAAAHRLLLESSHEWRLPSEYPRENRVERLRLLFTGRMIPAAELVDAGLVNEVVPDDQLDDIVMETVREIATKSPLGLRRMKELVSGALDQPIEQGLRAELLALAAHLRSHDMAEGLNAFREKRRPVFEGR